MILVKRGLITVVIGELCLAAIVQFPAVFQVMSLVGREEPFAHLLTAVDIEVSTDVVQLPVKSLRARLLVVGIRNTELQAKRSHITGINVVQILMLTRVLDGVGRSRRRVRGMGLIPLAGISQG